ncbi:protein FAM210B, mitochondrial isoform X2 [Mugil cephalus]|uniref:protein FAM210B, mitochondrial isoform X2 n=1 Tax=Mugil cephalus TaxID=48193 RepID=UPI001FB6C991|nr:protein FAM210B, mitochondrial isoform X2 [Mugil cephalus]
MLLVCRAGRLSAAALDPALKSPGWFVVQVKANRLTANTGPGTFQTHRLFCASVGGVDPSRAYLGKQRRDAALKWDTSSGFVTADRGHLDRVAAVAVNLPQSVQREGGEFDIIGLLCANGRHSSSRGQPAVNVLFTGNSWSVSSRRSCTRTMQTRSSSSTSAAAKKGDAGEEQAGGIKESLKEDPSSSSPEKVVGDTEPEGGKPNKTQQLKKVFKEYGAVGVCFHIGISLMSLGMFYLLISSGIDMAAVLCKVGFSESVVQSKMAAGTSTFVLAYAIHKLFAPVRISITLVSVPLIVRYFRRTGLFKPPTPAP